MDNDNYKLYTKDVLNLIFSNQDIDQLIPYLSKNVKAMGLYTEDVLKYNDIINHIKTYKSNHFTFYIDQFTCTVIYQNNSVCITEGVFYLNMEEYQTRTKYFYTIVFKDHQIELLHTSIGNTPKDLKEAPFILASCSFKLDEQLSIVDINDNLLELLLYDNKEEFLNDIDYHWINCIHKNDIFNVIKALSENVSALERHHLEYRIKRKDGSYLWIYDQGHFIFNNQKNLIVQCYLSDISSIKNRELASSVEKEKYQMALKDNSISILEYHIQDDRMIIDILEQSKKRIYDHYLDYVSSSKSTVFEEDKQKIVDLFTQKINGPIIYREYYRGSQEYCVKTLDATVIYNSNDEAEIILATASDITVNWHEQNSLKQQAQRDSLTHLYNLKAGKYIIDEYIKKNPKQQNALIVLDIDHFKEVNDTYGHLVGNELLIALAKYLLFHTNPNDIVIRMGGDEFVVFLKNVHDDLTYPCNQLMSHLNKISLSHHGIHFSISMGVYTFSNEQNFDNIFKIADDALYHSKRNGRNRYTIKYQK